MKDISASERFIPDNIRTWIPPLDEVESLILGDYWYSSNGERHIVPLFRNNKLVIRYHLASYTGKRLTVHWSEEHRNLVRQAHAALESHACIYFWDISDDADKTNLSYIKYIPKPGGCKSPIGRNPRSPTEITLQIPDCVVYDKIIHETMHALGFVHEHTRPDRDFFIAVNWFNIHQKYKSNFAKQKRQSRYCMDYYSDGFNYDYRSVMHYRPDAFAKNSLVPTLKPKMPNVKYSFLRGDDLSDTDQSKLQFYYSCSRMKPIIDKFKHNRSLFYYSATQTFGYRKSYVNILGF